MSETIEIKEHQMEGRIVYEANIPGYGEVTCPAIELPNVAMSVWVEAGLTRMEFPQGTEFEVEEGERVATVKVKP